MFDKDTLHSNFSKNLQYFRKAKGLSQEQLAFRFGLNRQRIGSYEECRAFPPAHILLSISKYMEVDINNLLEKVMFTKPLSDDLTKFVKSFGVEVSKVNEDANRVEYRVSDLDFYLQLAKNLIVNNKLNLEAYTEGNMASMRAFYVREKEVVNG